MSLNHDIQRFDQNAPKFDPGITVSGKMVLNWSEPSFSNFCKRYNASPEGTWKEGVATRDVDRKLNEVTKTLIKLTNRPANWDGYNSPPVRNDVALFALTILESIIQTQPRTPVPQVVPSAAGGVQLEWHEKDIDLEVNFSAPYECELWFEDHRTNAKISKDLTNDFSDLKKPIILLTTR